jgi:putative ABC transport system permease protein
VRPRLRLLGPLAGEATAQLRDRWREHALTLLGIVWGAASVVLLLALGSGFGDFLDLRLDQTGERWLDVTGGYTTSESDGRQPGRRIRLDLDDLERVRAGAGSASAVTAEIQEFATLESAFRTRASVVSAGGPELASIQNHRVAHGRYFDAQDEAAGRRVAVLGAELAGILFPGRDPLGERVQVRGVPFEVIGVLHRKGMQLMTQNDLHDRMLWLPLESGRRVLRAGRGVGRVFADLRRIDEEQTLRAEIRAALAPRHHLSDADDEALRFESVPSLMEPTRRIFFALRVLLGAIGSMTLVMSGVGVGNLMIAIVNERRPELALRRACGARRADLAAQLLAETLAVVLSGGLAGVAVGAAGIAVLGSLPLPAMIPSPHTSLSVLATTFLVLVGVGLGAGLAPARLASRIEPSAALRLA